MYPMPGMFPFPPYPGLAWQMYPQFHPGHPMVNPQQMSPTFRPMTQPPDQVLRCYLWFWVYNWFIVDWKHTSAMKHFVWYFFPTFFHFLQQQILNYSRILLGCTVSYLSILSREYTGRAVLYENKITKLLNHVGNTYEKPANVLP
jgi:hypothetical protein